MTTLGLLIVGSVAVWAVPMRYRSALWLLVIVAAVAPWSSLQDHAHWYRVRLVPFVSPPVKIQDIVGNLALYVPFGFFYARQRQGQVVLGRVMVYAVFVSICTEFSQVFSHTRFPSVQDVVMNTIGAGIGALLSRAHDNGRRI